MYKSNKSFPLIQAVIFLCLLLGACDRNLANPLPLSKHNSLSFKGSPPAFFGGYKISPIDIQEGKFTTVIGWLDNHTILYSTEDGNHGAVHVFDLYTSATKKIYESESSIVSVIISPSKDRILVHSSPAKNQAVLTFFDLSEKKIYEQKIAANEIHFEWNPYDENIVLVSLFYEDWTFKTNILDFREGRLTDHPLPQPFSYWINKSEVVYIDWDQNKLSLEAPLKRMDIHNKSPNVMSPNIYHVNAFKNKFFTISQDEADQEKAEYTFIAGDLKKLTSFSVPHLSRYSDWLVPFYDYNYENDQFITFQPLFSTDLDSYNQKFQLVSYGFESMKPDILFDGLENEPLICSPNGKMCLYGYSLEKLLNLESKSMIKLVKE